MQIYGIGLLKDTNQPRCKYCCADKDGYVTPIDKNGHFYVVDRKSEIRVHWYGHTTDLHIQFCPMCGRRLRSEQKVRNRK